MAANDELVGQLHRRKGKYGKWKPYMFAIRGCYLLEWKLGVNRLTVEPRHMYPLKGCFVEDGGALSGKSLAFIYHPPEGRSVTFLAETKAEKEQWKHMMLTAYVRTQERLKLSGGVDHTEELMQRLRKRMNDNDDDDDDNTEAGTSKAGVQRQDLTGSQPSQMSSVSAGFQRDVSLASITESSVSFDFPDNFSSASSRSSVTTNTQGGQVPVLTFLDNFTDAAIVANVSGMIVAVNRASERMFGYTKSELMNKSVNLLMPEPYKSQHDQYMHNYEQSGVANLVGKTRSFKGQRKDGSVFTIQISLGKLPQKGYFLATMRDLDNIRGTAPPLHEPTAASLSPPSIKLPESQTPALMLRDSRPAFKPSTDSVAMINPLAFGSDAALSVPGAQPPGFEAGSRDAEFAAHESVAILNKLAFGSDAGFAFSDLQPPSQFAASTRTVDFSTRDSIDTINPLAFGSTTAMAWMNESNNNPSIMTSTAEESVAANDSGSTTPTNSEPPMPADGVNVLFKSTVTLAEHSAENGAPSTTSNDSESTAVQPKNQLGDISADIESAGQRLGGIKLQPPPPGAGGEYLGASTTTKDTVATEVVQLRAQLEQRERELELIRHQQLLVTAQPVNIQIEQVRPQHTAEPDQMLVLEQIQPTQHAEPASVQELTPSQELGAPVPKRERKVKKVVKKKKKTVDSSLVVSDSASTSQATSADKPKRKKKSISESTSVDQSLFSSSHESPTFDSLEKTVSLDDSVIMKPRKVKIKRRRSKPALLDDVPGLVPSAPVSEVESAPALPSSSQSTAL